MASVDEIFKSAGRGGKRKLEAVQDPNELYKSAKVSPNSDARTAAAEDADDADDAEEAGPSMPPNDNADDDGEAGPDLPPDDEEGGRFFGGGVSARETQVLDYLDTADSASSALPDKIDVGWLRKQALNFEKRITKNAELRAKYEDQPARFIESEADLAADVAGWSVLSEFPDLWPEFVRLGTLESLVGLLAHDNTDVAIGVMAVLVELAEWEEYEGEDQQKWEALADKMMEADLVSLIVSNLGRLNEEEETDREGVFHALRILEQLGSWPSTAKTIGTDKGLLEWLLQRVQRKEDRISQNKQSAAEVMAILAQASSVCRENLIAADAVDAALQLVAAYRRRDPEKGSEEEEYMEDLFQALASLADEREGKAKFVEAEGYELCFLMLKEGKMSKIPALRLLDHVVGGEHTSPETCQKFVEAGGLKSVFTHFMKSKDLRQLPHLLGIFNSLLRHVPGQSDERIRLLAKFVESDYQKTSKLVSFHHDYTARLRRIDEQIAAERATVAGAPEEELEELQIAWEGRRYDEGGLHTLQAVDLVLAWLVAEDGGISKKITALLAERDDTLASVKASADQQLKAVQERLRDEEISQESKKQDLTDLADMLSTLLTFL